MREVGGADNLDTMDALGIGQAAVLLALHSVGANEAPVYGEGELGLAEARVAIHEAAQLHLAKGVLSALLEDPHVHVLHVMLDEEDVEAEIRLIEAGDGAGGVADDLGLGLVREHRFEVEIEEEPSAPDAIAAAGTLTGDGDGGGSSDDRGRVRVVELVRTKADIKHVADVLG